MFDGSTFSGEAPAGSWWPGWSALQGAVMRYISPRRIVLLAILVLLIAPWASAAPRHGSTPPASTSLGIPDVLSLAWSFITGGWIKTGCQIDPSGRCITTSSPAVNPENGHSPARRERRRPVLPTKEGCHIDPSGRCLP